eukprot:scaffold42705_cov54-Phaeocystis_antarctica.AAC.3
MLHVWATSPTKRETLAAPLGGTVTRSSGASSDWLSNALLADAAAALGPKRPSMPPARPREGFQKGACVGGGEGTLNV